MKTKRFYDIHFHAMDLSHPNLTAFTDKIIEGIDVDREDVKSIIRRLGCLRFLPVPACVLGWFPGAVIKTVKKIIKKKDLLKSANRARNLLSFMESPIEYDFLILEYFLKNIRPSDDGGFTPPVIENGVLNIGDTGFNRIVLCPLIIDFGYKNLKQTGVFYNIPPEKPVKKQITDIFSAIRTYYHNNITVESVESEQDGVRSTFNKFKTEKCDFDPNTKLFEIYPFMGINTANYDYDSIQNMLHKYFGDFSSDDTPDERYSKVRLRLGKFTGNLDNEENCRNIFAGIKVYPPLGFDPWPQECPACDGTGTSGCKCQSAKVKLLYSYCAERNIPVITHCSDGGFVADPDYLKLTNPANKWADVLGKYPKLKIDFAHFGRGNKEWETKIVQYLTGSEMNVFADFSCNTEGDRYYSHLDGLLNRESIGEEPASRILFGTDFMINMLWIESYNFYLKQFADSPYLSRFKDRFCHDNPERFLFGGSLTV